MIVALDMSPSFAFHDAMNYLKAYAVLFSKNAENWLALGIFSTNLKYLSGSEFCLVMSFTL